jgi:hypothetical protein
MLMCALQITDKRESHIGIAVMRRGAEKSSQYARVRQARAAFRDEWIQWHFYGFRPMAGPWLRLRIFCAEAAVRRQ